MKGTQLLRSAIAATMLLVALCAAYATAWPQGKAEKLVPNELPRAWSLKEIANKTPPYGAKGRVYVLAWMVREEERSRSGLSLVLDDARGGFQVESCLVLKVLDEDDGHGRWCLATLYRHPGNEKPEWRLSMAHYGPKPGAKSPVGHWVHHAMRLKTQPKNKELYAALPDLDWRFEQSRDWRYVSCCVCEKSWQEAIGERPTRFFGGETR
jgi:hypothetical protein